MARLAIAPSSAAARHDDLYLDRRFGIAFNCPPSWDFIRLDNLGELQNGQLLATDDDQSRAVLGSLDLPFVALAPRSNPHICVQMYLASPPNEGGVVHQLMKAAFNHPNAVWRETAFSGPIRIIRGDWQISRSLLKAFTVTQLPSEFSVSKCMAAQYTADYEFAHEQLETARRVTVQTVAIEHNPRYYLLRLISDASSPHDFSAFIDNIRLV